MANFKLSDTYYTDIQTTFRFEIHILAEADGILGLTQDVVGYIQQCDLPTAPGEPIIWHLPGGMKNHQAGKRTVQPISMTFVVPTHIGDQAANDAYRGSIYRMLEKWAHATYNLQTGANQGKGHYCTDAIAICLKGERDQDSLEKETSYTFRLKRAQVTNCNYGAVSSESNELIKVSCTFVYDDYELTKGYLGTVLRTS